MRAGQGALDFDVEHILQEINYPEIAFAFSKPELSDVEAVRLEMYLIMYFRNRESEWAQYQDGVLDEATWIRFRSSFASILNYQRARNWWANEGSNFLEPEFVAEVSAELAKIPVTNVTREAQLQSVFGNPAEHQRFLEADNSCG